MRSMSPCFPTLFLLLLLFFLPTKIVESFVFLLAMLEKVPVSSHYLPVWYILGVHFPGTGADFKKWHWGLLWWSSG